MADHKNPLLTCDVFIHDDNLNFILIKRKHAPFKDCWALPGGFVEYGESVETAAIREAKEETSIDVTLEDLVDVYSEPDRDPRGHTVTVAFTAKGDFTEKKADSDAKDIGVFDVDELDEIEIAFDHAIIINDCLKKVKK